MARLRTQVFSFLHTRTLSFFDTRPIGRLVTRVTNDVDAIGEMFSSGALNAIGDLLRLVAIVAVMLSIDVKMSLFTYAVLPPVMLLVNWTRKRMRTVYRRLRTKTARMNAFLNEQVNGIESCKPLRVSRMVSDSSKPSASITVCSIRGRSCSIRRSREHRDDEQHLRRGGALVHGGQAQDQIDFGTLFAFLTRRHVLLAGP